MKVKELLRQMLMSFFIVVTLVNVATCILGCVFQPERQFGYSAFLSPLIIGAYSMIPVLLSYSRKELSTRQIVIRKVLQLFLLEMLLYFVIFGKSQQQGLLGIMFEVSVAVIFVLVNLILAVINANDAKTLTKELKEFQQNISD